MTQLLVVSVRLRRLVCRWRLAASGEGSCDGVRAFVQLAQFVVEEHSSSVSIVATRPSDLRSPSSSPPHPARGEMWRLSQTYLLATSNPSGPGCAAFEDPPQNHQRDNRRYRP